MNINLFAYTASGRTAATGSRRHPDGDEDIDGERRGQTSFLEARPNALRKNFPASVPG